jgi:hypothetical protein
VEPDGNLCEREKFQPFITAGLFQPRIVPSEAFARQRIQWTAARRN